MNAENRRVDLLDPKTHIDPWPLYTWLREQAPVYWDDTNEVWCVSRYDHIIEVSRNPDLFTSTHGNRPKMPPDPSFINLDGRMHRARRKAVQHLFTPRAVAKLVDHLRDSVNALIDAFIEDGECDIVEQLTAPLPAQIIFEMCGAPVEIHDELRRCMDVFVQGGNGPDAVTEEVNEAFITLGGFHYMMVEERLAEPKDDLLSMWLTEEFLGRKLDEDEVLFEHVMMLIGGSETARNAITGGLEQLALHPDQRQLLIDEPERIPNAAEESIRWVTPFVNMSRTATADVEFHGKLIKEFDEVMLLYPAANRDPRHFPDPDSFDVCREFTSKILAFGHGSHFCLGAHLARMEARIMFEEVLRRMPDYTVGDAVWTESSFVRGISSLPARFTPGKREG